MMNLAQLEAEYLLSVPRLTCKMFLEQHPERGREYTNQESNFTYYALSDCLYLSPKGQALYPLDSSGRPMVFLTDSYNVNAWIPREYTAKNLGSFTKNGQEILRTDQAVALCPAPTKTFAHWFFETALKVLWFEKIVGYKGPYIVYAQTSWSQQLFDIFDISQERLLSGYDTNYHIGELFIPKALNHKETYLRSPELLKLFKSQLLEKIGILPGTKYCYVKRIHKRCIVNEEELLKVLDKYKFEILVPEKHTLKEQFRIMSNATLSVMAHGANNILTVAQPEGSGLIEFYNQRYVNYPMNAVSLNKMLFVPMTSLGKVLWENCKEGENPGTLNIEVDLDAFKVILEQTISFLEKKSVELPERSASCKVSLPTSCERTLVPCMSISERSLLEKYSFAGNTVLEFGAGSSSSSYFFSCNADTVISIDSNRAFVESLKSGVTLKEKFESKKWLPYVYNLGRLRKWGFPRTEERKISWPNYSSDIFKHIDVNKINCVLIDGRFRVACFLNVIYHIRKKIPIFFHDFTNREYYHSVLNFAKIVDKRDSLVVLNVLEDINYKNVLSVIEEYKYDPR